MNALTHLFFNELADRLDSELRLVAAMPSMIKAATCRHLQKLLAAHLGETRRQVTKLEKVFKSFNQKPKTHRCQATLGLLSEGAEVANDFKNSPAINAALVLVGQKIEHYEIAAYGSLREWSMLLGNRGAAALLGEILGEEKAANHALFDLAWIRCNSQALEAEEDAGTGPATKKKKRPLLRLPNKNGNQPAAADKARSLRK